jgi:hypothetical protein
MIADDFELAIRDRMKARAADFDRYVRPAPQLETVLGSGAGAARRLGLTSFRFGLGLVAAIVLALAVISGMPMLQRQPQGVPLATASPVLPSSAAPSWSPSPPPSRASPSPSPSPSPSLAYVLEWSAAV